MRTISELEAYQTRQYEGVMEAADAIKVVLRDNLPKLVAEHLETVVQMDRDFVAGWAPAQRAAYSAAARAAGEAAAADVLARLDPPAVWLPDVQAYKDHLHEPDLTPVPAVWHAIQAVAHHLDGVIERYDFPPSVAYETQPQDLSWFGHGETLRVRTILERAVESYRRALDTYFYAQARLRRAREAAPRA